MTNLEHYFENLLYHGEDIKGEANKNALTEEQQKSVEQCAQYVIYSLFGTREHFDEWINREPASPWHRVEEPPKEDGWYMLGFLSRWKNGSWWIPKFPDYWMTAEPPKEDV